MSNEQAPGPHTLFTPECDDLTDEQLREAWRPVLADSDIPFDQWVTGRCEPIRKPGRTKCLLRFLRLVASSKLAS